MPSHLSLPPQICRNIKVLRCQTPIPVKCRWFGSRDQKLLLVKRERGKWPNLNGEGSTRHKHKSSLRNRAKEEPADSAWWTRSEGRNGTKLVFQAANQNRLKLHKKALIYEQSHTKKGVCCTRKGSTAGLMSFALNLHSQAV